MDNTKFNLVSIILLVVLIGLGALAIITLTPPKRYSAQPQQVATATDDVVQSEETPAPAVPAVTPESNTAPAPATPSTTTQHAELIAAIETMIKAKTILKAGDKGPNVGTIQTFFNLYNKTNTRVDNDFGPGLTSTVKSFQSKNNITPQSGQVAEKTMTQMVTWLKSQN